AARPRLVRSTPLDEKQTMEQLARIPPIKGSTRTQPFNPSDRFRPPPRPGETVQTPFPPPAARAPPPAVGSSRAVSLLRFAPEGDVELAPNLSLTFSEPMVAVTSANELELRGDPPARLSPEPPGRWRWIGTQTLLFEPNAERFPKATDYTIEVPASLRSAAGRALGKTTKFGFRLPAV